MIADDLLLYRLGPMVADVEPDKDEAGSIASLVARINALQPPPPAPLTAADVRIYCALVANDQPDAYSTQFTPGALEQVARGIVGMPAMRNHQTYDSHALPVGRWFHGDVITEGSVTWARGWFYMSADVADAEAAMLAARIAAGVLREVSLSWYQDGMTCSVCGMDMWGKNCPHIPGEQYESGTCVGIMEHIKCVEEASLVWKGGQYGTEVEPVGRDMPVQRASLVQRIASKRSARPASAGESDLQRWFRDDPVQTLEAFFKAG